MINYDINESGTMTIYIDNYSICEISNCKDLTNNEINDLINEIIKESEITLNNGKLTKTKVKYINIYAKDKEYTKINEYMAITNGYSIIYLKEIPSDYNIMINSNKAQKIKGYYDYFINGGIIVKDIANMEMLKGLYFENVYSFNIKLVKQILRILGKCKMQVMATQDKQYYLLFTNKNNEKSFLLAQKKY